MAARCAFCERVEMGVLLIVYAGRTARYHLCPLHLEAALDGAAQRGLANEESSMAAAERVADRFMPDEPQRKD